MSDDHKPHLTGDQMIKLRAMVEAGFTQAGIAEAFGLSLLTVRRLVAEMRQANQKPKRQRTRDVELRDMLLPGGDPYRCTTGENDRYLAALKRHFPERMP